MLRDDTDPDREVTPGWPTDSAVPTAPFSDAPPEDVRKLYAMLADLRWPKTPGGPDSAGDGGDSTAMLAELQACLQLAMGTWPRPGDGGPRRVGRFELLEERGRGGFGIVYRAFDPLLRRFVALKVPRVEGLALPELRRRFLREARAAGALEHPNIVPVFEAGEDGPLCYLAAGFVDGPTLSSWLYRRASPVPPADAAALLASMADAVHHAHTRGVLHRDLKPSNVLLQGGGPGLPTPRLTDFGLARLREEAGDDSRSGVPMGSPSYMSPEQAAGRRREVGPAADVYGLGAVFYEILAGRPPFRGETPMETVALVLAEEPVPPRATRPGLPRELETICLTCLQKDPARRYPSAEALAADLRRWLAGDPIAARPPSAGERLGRWARRHPARAAAVGVLAALATTAAGALVARDFYLASHGQVMGLLADEASRQKERAEHLLEASRLKQVAQALSLGDLELAQDILDDLPPRSSRPGTADFLRDYLRRQAGASVDALRGHHRGVIQLAVSPRTGAIASVDLDEVLLLRGPDGRSAPIRLAGGVLGATYPAFSGDGRFLAAFETDGSGDDHRRGLVAWDGRDGRLLCRVRPGDVTGPPRWFGLVGDAYLAGLWPAGPDRDTLRIWSLCEPVGPTPSAVLSVPAGSQVAVGGRRLAVVSVGRLDLVDPTTGEVCRELPDGPRAPLGVACSRDDQTIALWDAALGFELRDSASGALLGRAAIPDTLVPPLCSPDGSWAAMVDKEGRVVVLGRDGRGPRLIEPDAVSRDGRARLDFSPGGDRLAISFWSESGYRQATTVFRVADGEELARYPGRPRPLSAVAFGDDGRSVVLAAGPTLRRWRLDCPPEPPDPAGHDDEAWSVAFSPFGRYLATGSDDTDEPETLKVWEAATGQLLRSWKAHPATVGALAFSPCGRYLASAGLLATDNLRVWDATAEGKLRFELVGHTHKVRTVAFSPNGRLLASAGSDCSVRLWDMADGTSWRVLGGPSEVITQVAFSPDGRTVSCCDNSGAVWSWDLATGIPRVVIARADTYTSLAYSPDGRTLAVGDEAGSVTLIDPDSGRVLDTLRGDDGAVRALAYSPDGRALAVGGLSRTVRVWDAMAGLDVLTIDDLGEQVNGLAFSPDGRTLASCSHDGAVRLWRSGPGSR